MLKDTIPIQIPIAVIMDESDIKLTNEWRDLVATDVMRKQDNWCDKESGKSAYIVGTESWTDSTWGLNINRIWAGISVPAIEWTQVQMFLRRVARSEAGTQEAGARQWPQETAPPHSSRAREGGKMETRMPQCKPLTSDVKLIGQPWLHWTMCSPFYLDKWSEALVAQSCLALCEPADCILPVSSARGISQARISSGLPFSSPGNLPDPGVKPRSPTLQADSLLSEPQGEQYAFIKTI